MPHRASARSTHSRTARICHTAHTYAPHIRARHVYARSTHTRALRIPTHTCGDRDGNIERGHYIQACMKIIEYRVTRAHLVSRTLHISHYQMLTVPWALFGQLFKESKRQMHIMQAHTEPSEPLRNRVGCINPAHKYLVSMLAQVIYVYLIRRSG